MNIILHFGSILFYILAILYFIKTINKYTFITNKKNIEFICPVCKTIEKIPREIVEMLDAADQHGVDTYVPPRFDCEKCYEKMVSIFYIGVKGKIYKYDK